MSDGEMILGSWTQPGVAPFDTTLWAPPGHSALPEPRTLEPRALEPRTVETRSEAELLAAYTPLARQIAGGFQRRLPRNVLKEDLLAAAMSGLWDAVRRQLAEPCERFDFYVRVRIRGAIVDELRAQDWLPRRARAQVQQARANSTTPTITHTVVRFDDVSESEQGRCLASEDREHGEAALEAKAARDALVRAVEQLPERERQIVAEHYFQGVKFKDLGTALGVSEPRVSQLHSRALQRLKTLMATL